MYTKDFAGNEVREGDKVGFVKPNSRRLVLGIVKNITKKGVTVETELNGRLYTCSRKSNQFALYL